MAQMTELCPFQYMSYLYFSRLGVFTVDGQSCSCGNQFACEHPFPMGKIQGRAVATGIDEMIVHAAKLCNALIIKGIKANENKV